ncbi:MAG: hypothetical protein ABI912_06720 [Actinomycetota bacterium]
MDTKTRPAAPAPTTARYRAINPRGYYAAPVGVLSAARYSPAMGLATLLIVGVLIAVLRRFGSDMNTEGVVVHRGTPQPLVRWSDIADVEVVKEWYNGQRIRLVRTDGRTIVLPAPTSNLAGFTEGLARAKAHAGR